MTTRREVLAAGAAIAAALLAGCSDDDDDEKPSLSGGTVDVPKSDVPVGGGIVLEDSRVVVTQPVEGTFLAFSAVCTHEGCIVREVRPTGIYCACHGSLFDASDGSALEGPAEDPLLPTSVTDNGDTLTVAT